MREPLKVPCEPNIASAKAKWVSKSTVASLESASHEAKIFLDHKTPSAPQLCLSYEAKVKAPCTYSKATVASLASTTLVGSVKPITREAKTKAPARANSVADPALLSAPSAKKLCCKAPLGTNSEAHLTSLTGKVLHKRAKFASKGRN